MNNLEDDNFRTLYKKLVSLVMDKGQDVVVNHQITKEIIGCSICLNNTNNYVLDFKHVDSKRHTDYERYLHNEIPWYESGCLIAAHAPSSFWKKIADDDGKIQSNYGYMILFEKKPYCESGITSFLNALNILKDDKFSRQAILHYNLPQHYDTGTKDIPCTISTQIIIRNDLLQFLVFQRSSDLYKGLIYDLPWHCHLMRKFAQEINKDTAYNITLGSLTMVLGSVHIYDENISFFNKYLKEEK